MIEPRVSVQSDAIWRPLFKLGACVAIAMLALVPVAMVGFLIAPPPTSAEASFALFARSRLLGVVSLDGVYMLEIVLAGVLLLVLGVALRRESPPLVAIAMFLNTIATSMYFASNTSLEMLGLSRQHAAATTDAQRDLFVAAGEGMLMTYRAGTAYSVSYVLAGAAGLIVALVMLRGRVFGRVTAWLGIAMGALALIPPSVGTVGVFAAFLYLVPLLPWLALVARRLLQLARSPD